MLNLLLFLAAPVMPQSSTLDVSVFESAEYEDLVGGNGVGFLHTDSLYLGCFYTVEGDYGVAAEPIPAQYTGVARILNCYNAAVNSGYTVFGLGRGLCFKTGEHYPIDYRGKSKYCNLPCGNDTLNSGAICGGEQAISWYQVETEPTHSFAYPTTSYIGCYADDRSNPVFPSVVALAKIYSSVETINICQRLAAKNGAVLYALQNGNECHYGPANTAYNKYGASADSCTSVCGFDSSINALNCGGPSSNTVYQLSGAANGNTAPVSNPNEITSINGQYLPKSRFNSYIYRGCYANGPKTILNGESIILKNSRTAINDCYDYASTKSASFFGLTNGTTCTYGSQGIKLNINGKALSNSMCTVGCRLSTTTTLTAVATPSTIGRKSKTQPVSLVNTCTSVSSIYQIKLASDPYEYKVDGKKALREAKAKGLIGSFVYIGCFYHVPVDAPPLHIYDGNICPNFYESGTFGHKFCTNVANEHNATYYGIQVSNYCMYGNNLPPVQVAETYCRNRCGDISLMATFDHLVSGEISEIPCGGDKQASFYQRVV